MGVTGRAAVALTIELAFFVLAVGVRMWMQHRRTGASGFKIQKFGASTAERAVEWFMGIAGVTLIAGTVAGLAGLTLGGPEELPVSVVVVASVLAVAAIAATFWAQLAMGDSWRIGQDQTESTALVTGGPFRFVRNPIYTAMIVFFAAVLVVLPNVATAVSFVATILAIELVVRGVEEPFLRERHGVAYADWCAQAGRFLPGIGRA